VWAAAMVRLMADGWLGWLGVVLGASGGSGVIYLNLKVLLFQNIINTSKNPLTKCEKKISRQNIFLASTTSSLQPRKQKKRAR
jgi:hypothetical protein